MKIKNLILLLAIAAIPFAGYCKISVKGYGASGLIAGVSSKGGGSASALGKKTFTYGDISLEPEDSLSFSLEDMEDSIDGYEVLSEYLPGGIEITWTGSRFKVPRAGKVKYSKKEGDFVTTNDDNPCGLTISITKKGKVSGSFKVYVAKSETKVKAYTAKFSGYLGSDGISVSIKKAGIYTAATLD